MHRNPRKKIINIPHKQMQRHVCSLTIEVKQKGTTQDIYLDVRVLQLHCPCATHHLMTLALRPANLALHLLPLAIPIPFVFLKLHNHSTNHINFINLTIYAYAFCIFIL